MTRMQKQQAQLTKLALGKAYGLPDGGADRFTRLLDALAQQDMALAGQQAHADIKPRKGHGDHSV